MTPSPEAINSNLSEDEKRMIDTVLDEQEKEQTLDVKIIKGVKHYKINRKGRQMMANRAIHALEVLNYDVKQVALDAFKHYVVTGVKDKFVEDTIHQILPYVEQEFDKGLTSEQIAQDFKK